MKKTLTLIGILSLTTLASQAQQLFSNGTIATGTAAKNGTVAPTGTQWSEVQNDNGNTAESNSVSGFSATSPNELADDFTVPAGQRWTVSSFSFFGYQTGAVAATSPISGLTLRIWNGQPGTTGATVIFGDATTNRIGTSTDALTYRIFNSLYPSPGSTVGTTRKVWEVQALVSPALVLQPGTYWVDWSSTATNGAGHFYVPVTITGTRGQVGANALNGATASGVTTWTPLSDAGTSSTTTPKSVAQDMAFRVFGTSTPLATRVGQAGPDGLSLQVWPVPATETANIAVANAKGNTELRLSDLTGRLIWTGSVPMGTTEAAVPVASLGAGVYMLEARTATGSVRASVVKK